MRGDRKILIVGFGDIGERVARALRLHAGRHFRLSALVRSADAARRAKMFGVQPVRGDLANPQSLTQLAGRADVVFHFAPPPSRGHHDTHTRHLLAALARPTICPTMRPTMRAEMLTRHLPRKIIYISTTGVYGDCGGAWIDETHPARPANERARRRVDAEHQLREWGIKQSVDVTILRAPGIYAIDRLPLARLRQGTPALVAQDDVFTNHIHADDLARAAIAAMHSTRSFRIYNVVDDSAMTMGEYFDRVADVFELPRPPRISRNEAATRLSPALLSFMGESRRIRNTRMKRELAFRLTYPTVDEFLRELKRN